MVEHAAVSGLSDTATVTMQKRSETRPHFRHIVQLCGCETAAIAQGEVSGRSEETVGHVKVHNRCRERIIVERISLQPVQLIRQVFFAALVASKDKGEAPDAIESIVESLRMGMRRRGQGEGCFRSHESAALVVNEALEAVNHVKIAPIARHIGSRSMFLQDG